MSKITTESIETSNSNKRSGIMISIKRRVVSRRHKATKSRKEFKYLRRVARKWFCPKKHGTKTLRHRIVSKGMEGKRYKNEIIKAVQARTEAYNSN